MKKIILALSASVICFSASAQIIDNKVLTVFTEAYLPLSASTVVVDSINWQDPGFQIPLGFPYTFLGKTTSNLFGVDGLGLDGFLFSGNTANVANGLGLFTDFKNNRTSDEPTNPNSTIAYQTNTIAGKKITKIQYENVGFSEDSTNTDYVNFQTWVYEADSAIEYRIGKSLIDGDNFGLYFLGTGPSFVYAKDLNNTTQNWAKMYYVSGLLPIKGDSITLAQVIANGGFKGMPTYPDSGTVIRLAPIKVNVGINQVQLNDNIVLNNLITENLELKLLNNTENHTVKILDMHGKEIMNRIINQASNTINCSQLPSGNYIVSIANKQANVYYQIAKQ
jgi:Secretion system C-terminal sorting domain